MFAWLPECGWTLAVLRPNSFFRAVNRKLLDLVSHVFAAAITSVFWDTPSAYLFVSTEPWRFQHRRTDKIFAGNQFDFFCCARARARWHQPQWNPRCANARRRSQAQFEFVDAAFMASALEFCVEEGIEDFPARLSRRGFGRRGKGRLHCCAGAQGRGRPRRRQSAARTPGTLLAADVHADAVSCKQQAEFRAACGTACRRRLERSRIRATSKEPAMTTGLCPAGGAGGGRRPRGIRPAGLHERHRHEHRRQQGARECGPRLSPTRRPRPWCASTTM